MSTVRYIKRPELSAAARIEKKTHANHKDKRWSEGVLKGLLAEKKTRAFVILEGKEVVGFLFYDYAEGDTLVIKRLSVDPDYRRNGFGTKLLRRLASHNGRYHGCGKVHVYVYEEDRESQEFYRHHGFVSQVVKNHFGPDKPAYLFVTKQTELPQ